LHFIARPAFDYTQLYQIDKKRLQVLGINGEIRSETKWMNNTGNYDICKIVWIEGRFHEPANQLKK